MSNDQLHMDADALDGFTSQFNNLIHYESATLFPLSLKDQMGDDGVENTLADLANSDTNIDQRLSNYLGMLAEITGAAAQATRDLDQKLAQQANTPSRGKHT